MNKVADDEIPQHIYRRIGEIEEFMSGATLRDQFAMAALRICLKDLDKSYDDWADEAYKLADAMLATRKKGN